MMSARREAVCCLCEVQAGAYSNLTFKRRMKEAALNARDVNFCARLFYGTLERSITLDFALRPWLRQGVSGLDAEVRAILRMGLYQILFMDGVPDSAAVNESVKLCKVFGKKSAAGLVNAVLRCAATFDIRSIRQIEDETRRLSLQYAVCEEYVQLLQSQYGSETESILEATLRPMPPAVRVNTLRTTAAALQSRLDEEEIRTAPAAVRDALIVLSGRYLESAALRDGTMRVQSEAAQFAVSRLGLSEGQSLLDLCAAPGGKALTAAQQMGGKGHITAVDIHENRLMLIKSQAVLEGVDIIRTVCADATLFEEEALYDAVLCDVPCSGYGEMARKPELRQKAPGGRHLSELQGKILANGAQKLRVGGRLVYATCTLDKRENENVVDDFLARHSRYRAVDTKCLPNIAQKAGKYVKFVPRNNNNEGFFVATLERV